MDDNNAVYIIGEIVLEGEVSISCSRWCRAARKDCRCKIWTRGSWLVR